MACSCAKTALLFLLLLWSEKVAGDRFLRRQNLFEVKSSLAREKMELQLEDEDMWERMLQFSVGSIDFAETEPPVAPPSMPPPTPAPTAQMTPSPPGVTESNPPTAAPSDMATTETTPSPTFTTPTATPTGVATTAAPTVPVCESLVWSDEFNSDGTSSSPDETIWSYDLGNGVDGWGNLELQQYTSDLENVKIDDGTLVITVNEDDGSTGRTFSSGRIRTEDKVEVLYGNIEARIKIPSIGDGLWPAFWSLGGNHREVGWPSSGEIDIMEMGSGGAIADGVVHRRVTSAAHREVRGNQATITASFDAPMDLNDGEFHIFRSEWTSTRLATYVDDNLILEMDISQDVCSDCSEFHQPHFLILNVAVGGYFTGILDAAGITAPLLASMIVDYVRVCDNGETIMSGSVFEDPVEYLFDCGAPDTCTASALNNYAGEATCGARIQFLVDSGMSEEEACRQVAGTDHSAECGQCAAQVINCGLDTCTDAALDSDAAGLTCRERIGFLVGIYGQTEREACNRVGSREHPAECGACNPIDCDQPDTCVAEVLNSDAGGETCRDRISFLIGNGSSESDACKQVAGVEFSDECGPCDVIDCNNPTTCTNEVLETDAGGFTCRSRITFLISSSGLSEEDACQQIAGVEFPVECGACIQDRLDCGVPDTCTREVLDMDAGGFPCNDRIEFLISSQGFSETDACNQVAVVEFPSECGPCAPAETSLDCGLPETCTEAVLASDAGGFPCSNRITFLIESSGLDEIAACTQVASEFPVECAGCDPSSETSLDCGLPETCTDAVLASDAGGFPCSDRITFLIESSGLDEIAACAQVASEFSVECAGCDPS